MNTKMNWLDHIARLIQGADRDVLALCPTSERRRILNRSVLILLPSLVALFSSYCTADLYLDNPWALGGVMVSWSTFVLLMDRAIVIQTETGKFSFAFVVRGTLAVVLSMLLAEPIVQFAFADEIKQRETAKRQIAADEVDARYAAQKQRLIDEINFAEAEKLRTSNALMLEVAGLGGSKKYGNGPATQLIKEESIKREQEAQSIRERNTAALQQLEQTKTGEKEEQMRAVATHLSGRLRTLHELMSENWVIAWAVWLVRLALFIIEILPLTLKFGKRQHRDEFGNLVSDEIYEDMNRTLGEEHVKSMMDMSEVRQHNHYLSNQLHVVHQKMSLEMRLLRLVADQRRLQISFIVERQRAMEQLKEEAIASFEMMQPDEAAQRRYRQYVERISENYQRSLHYQYQKFAAQSAGE